MQPATVLHRYMTLGAVPFVLLSLSVWIVPGEFSQLNYQLFGVYSALIFCFMIGTIWGAQLAQPKETNDTGSGTTNTLSIAIAGSLIPMFALLIPPLWGTGLLMAAFIALPSVERYSNLPFPNAYLELRSKINRTVVVSHLIILVHMLQALNA